MPGFDPTILRDEEKVGGFEPNNSGDETFLLEQLPSYPGRQDQNAAAAPVVDPPAVDTVPPDIFAPVSEPEVAFPVEDTAMGLTDTDEYERVPEQPMDTVDVEDVQQGVYNDPLVLDDSLIALLKADLADSKKRKEKEVEPVAKMAGPPPSFSDEERVAGEEGTGVDLDLSSIDADYPSTYGIDRSLPPNRPDEPVAPPIVERRDPEKKRRRFFAWPLVAGVGLLLLLLLGAAAYFYFVPIGGHKTTALHDSSAVSEHHTEHTTTGVHDSSATHGAEVHDNHTGAPDTSIHGSAVAGHDTVSSADSGHTTAVAATGHGVTSSDHSAKSNQIASVEQPSNHSAHADNAGRKSPVVSAPAAVAKEPVARPHSSAAKETPIKTETKPKSRPYKPESPPSASAQGEYVIQVYASPSADDADEWLQQLRKRSINDGFISSQSVRGQTWYRVRFGKFTTRDEADARASQLGFSNVWVVRVK